NIELRSSVNDDLIASLTLRDVLLDRARGVIDRIGFVDLLYSMGTSVAGAITLRNTPQDLLRLERPGGSVIDLGTTELVRDRERGIPTYNQFRRSMRMRVAKSFEEISDDPSVIVDLYTLYENVEDVDLLVGLLAETPPAGFAFSDTAFRIFTL